MRHSQAPKYSPSNAIPLFPASSKACNLRKCYLPRCDVKQRWKTEMALAEYFLEPIEAVLGENLAQNSMWSCVRKRCRRMDNRRAGRVLRDSGSSSRNRSQKSQPGQPLGDQARQSSDPAAAAHSRLVFSRQPRELASCRDGIGGGGGLGEGEEVWWQEGAKQQADGPYIFTRWTMELVKTRPRSEAELQRIPAQLAQLPPPQIKVLALACES